MAEVASAFVSLMPSARGFGSSAERQISPQMDSVGKTSGSRFGKSFAASTKSLFKGLAVTIGGLFAAQQIGKFFGDSIAEAREAAVVTARTENVIKSMGLSSKVSASQVADLAMSISNKTAVDDEAIQSGQNLLLTFGNIASSAGKANGVFAQTSQLMVDMSAAMGTDVKSSAIQLGKALNDPTKGVTALARAGVSFTQQQKDQIKALQESGDMLGAQNIILGEVKKQFGGAAAAMSTPADRAKVAWANFQEQIGTLLLPVVDKLLSTLSGKVIPAISNFIAQIQSGTGVGGQFRSAFEGISGVLSAVFGFIASNKEAVATFAGILLSIAAAVKVWTVAQIALNIAMTANPIGIVVVALAALAAGLVLAYQKSETFRTIVNAVFEFLKTAVVFVVNFVKDHWQLMVAAILGPMGLVVLGVIKYWDQIKAATTAVWNAVKAVISAVWTVISTVIKTELAIVKTVVTTAWNAIKTVTSTVWNAIKAVISTQINAAKAVVSTGVDGIKTAFGKIADLVGKVRGWFGDIVTAIRNKFGEAVGAVSSVVERIKTALSPVTAAFDAVKDAINAVISAIKSIPTPNIKIPNIPGVPGLATGGRVMSGQTYLVGEQGPELFTSSRAGYIVPNHKLTAAPGGGMSDGAVLAELRALRAAVGAIAPGVGREINGAVSHGQKKAS